jgi:hypothetical protein
VFAELWSNLTSVPNNGILLKLEVMYGLRNRILLVAESIDQAKDMVSSLHEISEGKCLVSISTK